MNSPPGVVLISPAELDALIRRAVRDELAAQQPKLLSMADAAAELHCNVDTVRRMVRRGELQATRFSNGKGGSSRVRFTRVEVERAKRDGGL